MGTLTKRNIIKIDEDKCTGCGLCVPSCAEGAIQIVNGKARLVSERYCDGLGACLGECPEGALQVIEREAEAFDEAAVQAYLGSAQPSARAGHAEHPGPRPSAHAAPAHAAPAAAAPAAETIRAHVPRQHGGAPHACPGARMMHFEAEGAPAAPAAAAPGRSRLTQWPVQLMLVPVEAPYFKNADILVAADCVPFALAGFHEELLKGKAVVVGCPKLDDVGYYAKKLAQIFSSSNAKSVTVATMEVPCCSGMVQAVYEALDMVDRSIPVYTVTVGIRGQVLSEVRSR
jgi:Pyruvate/2-oxoacid:ferredoxin oxidoreductase delta subunit